MERPDIEVLNLTHKGTLRFGKKKKQSLFFPRKVCWPVKETTPEQSDFWKLNNVEAEITTRFPNSGYSVGSSGDGELIPFG